MRRPVRALPLRRSGDDLIAFVHAAAPKRRGKRRLDFRALLDPAAATAMFNENFYSPRILADGADLCAWLKSSGVEFPVTAHRLHRGVPVLGDKLMLRYTRDIDGVLGWCGIVHREMAALLEYLAWLIFEWVAPRIEQAHRAGFDFLVESMALNEIDDLVPIIEGVRQTLRDPTNPIRRPPRLHKRRGTKAES